jgi:hypothetical protein
MRRGTVVVSRFEHCAVRIVGLAQLRWERPDRPRQSQKSSRVTMHVNKVHHVTTIRRVAEHLGEMKTGWARRQRKWMSRTASFQVYGVGEDGVLAFTDFGIDNLVELVKIYKQSPVS